MREFLVRGGSHDGRVVQLHDGLTVRFGDTGEEYRVLSEPYGNSAGVLIPSAMTNDEAFEHIVRGLGDEAVEYFLGADKAREEGDQGQASPRGEGDKAGQ